MNKLVLIDKTWLLAINRFADSSTFWQIIFKFFGIYLIYAVPLFLLAFWFYSNQSKKVALRATIAGLFAWVVVSKIIAELVRRPRPLTTGGVKELLFNRGDFSFPSDHAAFLFAIALSFYLSGYKKIAYILFCGAVVISFARIGLGVHYPSDVFAGAAIGLIVAWLFGIFDRPLAFLYNFLIGVAHKLKLA